GVGLIGVTHANRAIDAVQRLIGRVELGMIPQVVDTVLFIDAGKVAQVLELEFTVKVPVGMTDADLARPVVVVRDVRAGREVYELYTYGEQIVVMPLDSVDSVADPASQLAERELTRMLRRNVQGPMEVQVRGGKATVYVDEGEVPQLIGKGGRTVQMLERKLGIGLDIKPLVRGAGRKRQEERPQREESGRWDEPDGSDEGDSSGAAAIDRVRIKRASTNIFLLVDGARGGRTYRVEVEGALVGEATASQQGRLRFKLDSPEGIALAHAQKAGLTVTVAEA
ncbi:MAG: ATPase, partial [Thermoplasmatota archaeon]